MPIQSDDGGLAEATGSEHSRGVRSFGGSFSKRRRDKFRSINTLNRIIPRDVGWDS